MSASDILIRLGADFTGKPAFESAKKSTSDLEKAVGKMGKAFATAFSAYKIAQFGKESVKAFANDQKQVVQLTSAVKSLGLAFAAPEVNKYIDDLERLSGINRDILQPAFQKLLTQTRSIAKSQEILNTSIAVSKSGVMSLEEASNALSQAFVGNTKGIKQFNIGLTNAEIQALTFDELLKRISSTYKDQYAASLDTVATKMDKLTIAVGNAKESIGGGLVNAFANLVGGGSIDKATLQIENLGKAIGDVISRVTSKGWLQFLNWLNPANVGNFASSTDLSKITGQGSYMQYKVQQAQRTKVEKEALARAKALAAEIKKQQAEQAKLLKQKQDAAKLDALSLQYKKAESIFDMEKIEIQAAMMNKQTAEDYARLKLKQDLNLLQDAINAKDVAAATALAKVVEEDLKRVQAYQAINIAAGIQSGLISNIQAASSLIPKDMKLIDLQNLDDALKAILAIIDALSKIQMPSFGGGGGGGGSSSKVLKKAPKGLVNPDGTLTPKGLVNLPSIDETPMESFLRNYEGAIGVINKNNEALQPLIESGFFGLAYNASEFLGTNINPYAMTDAQAKAYIQGQLQITVNNNTGGLADIIMSTTQDQSANGISTRVTRNTTGLNW